MDMTKRDTWTARVKAANGAIVPVAVNASDVLTAIALIEQLYGKKCIVEGPRAGAS